MFRSPFLPIVYLTLSIYIVFDVHELHFTLSHDRMTFDLNEGMETVIKKDKAAKNEKLDKLLEWILMNKAEFSVNDQSPSSLTSLSTDFVCFRGLLTTLMCTPYERRADWEFVALKYKETIYLHRIETEQQRMFEQSKNDRQRQMESWGFKFEQFILSDSINDSEKRNSDAWEKVNMLKPIFLPFYSLMQIG